LTAVVMAELDGVDFLPPSEELEILQNVRTILTTLKRTVPLDRDFGIDVNALDAPIGTAQARLSAALVEAVQKYEPRVSVTNVIFDCDEEDGTVDVGVEVKINES